MMMTTSGYDNMMMTTSGYDNMMMTTSGYDNMMMTTSGYDNMMMTTSGYDNISDAEQQFVCAKHSQRRKYFCIKYGDHFLFCFFNLKSS